MAKQSLKIDLSALATNSRSLIHSMAHELEGKDSGVRRDKAAPKRRWGIRFAASGLKSAPPRR